MNDPLIREFMQHTLYSEVIPTLSLPREDLHSFAEAVTARFGNPFIRHALLSICLNSVSKWRARCMPSLVTYVQNEGVLPERLTFSLAALISLYRGGKMKDGKLECVRNGEVYLLQDDAAVLTFFDSNRQTPASQLCRSFVETFYGELMQIPGLVDAVCEYLGEIESTSVRAVMLAHFGG